MCLCDEEKKTTSVEEGGKMKREILRLLQSPRVRYLEPIMHVDRDYKLGRPDPLGGLYARDH